MTNNIVLVDHETRRLEQVFKEILVISKGECQITDERLLEEKDPRYFDIFSGLQMLHQDLDLYKKEIALKLEAEYKLEVLKKKNEELAQFNYVASHDLQEPLRTIQSFTDLLLKDNADQLDPKGKLYLKFINDSSTRMSELIFGLLNYSKVGKSLQFEEVDCNLLLKEILSDLNHTIQKTLPIINVGDLPKVNADKVRLRQVFQNLISNALKFKKEDSPITLNISVETNNEEYIFCFKDNGIGIEEEFQERIFGIFQRLHNKTEFEGTGIGLALCKKIVEMHQGRIWLKSVYEAGSEFYFSVSKKLKN